MAHHKVNLNDFKERKGKEGRIDVETDAGVFTIPPPELWPDEVLDGTLSDVDVARALIGTDRYDDFKAAGGSAALVASIVEDCHGEKAGK